MSCSGQKVLGIKGATRNASGAVAGGDLRGSVFRRRLVRATAAEMGWCLLLCFTLPLNVIFLEQNCKGERQMFLMLRGRNIYGLLLERALRVV